MNVICTICLDDLSPRVVIVGTSCGHVYHRKCMNEWLSRSKFCPQCRHPLNKGDVGLMFLKFSENDEVEKLQMKLLQSGHANEEASARIMFLESRQEELIGEIGELERKLESMSRSQQTEAENSVASKTKMTTAKTTKKKTVRLRVPLSTLDENVKETRSSYNLRPRY